MSLSITLLLIIATGLVSVMAFQRPELKGALSFSPYAVQHRGQWYRLFSHALIHADWPHLGLNMFVLFSFGSVLERELPGLSALPANVLFLALYLGGALFASLPGMAKYRNDPRYSSLGASGAVAAVLFAMIVIRPLDSIWLFGIVPLPAVLFGGLYLYYSYAMDKRGGTRVAHDAHLYGAIYGVLFTIAMDPDLVLRWFQ
ncbi:MAG: rhomboid family intramembrane serine protease [Flavobacteriales bacterium]|nr:rhomboid family intramembrane serine protease [Flavobacteriales bacterium]